MEGLQFKPLTKAMSTFHTQRQNTKNISSFIWEFLLFSLMVVAFRNYTAAFGPEQWVPSCILKTHHSAALLL